MGTGKTFILIFLSAVAFGYSQNKFDDIHLFQTFMQDATITSYAYDEAFIDYNNYDFGTQYALGLQGGFVVKENIEINGRLGFGGLSIRDGNSETSLTDLDLSGRYLFYDERQTQIAVGGSISFPFGDENAGYGNFGLGGFGALRHKIHQQLLLTSSLAFDIVDTGVTSDESNSAISLSGGLIYLLNDRLGLVGEIRYRTNLDYALLSFGGDYALAKNRLRSAIGFGLDDGAPDFRLQVGYIFSF